MKRGWLIYEKDGAQKNQWFISRLIEEFRLAGVELSLYILQENQREFIGETPDFAIVRAIAPYINKTLETCGVRVFNNSETAKTACDKWQTFQKCKEWNIPLLDTVKHGEKMDFPCVMKSRNGHGGAEVFWIENEEQAREIIEKNPNETGYIFQKINEILGKDMRVYAIGGEIVASVMRTSKQDFRSNFSLGGKVGSVKADETQKQIVKTLYEKLSFDYIGIDFLPTKTGWVLNEIEDSAGARMLYSCTDIDIVKLFVAHVLKNI